MRTSRVALAVAALGMLSWASAFAGDAAAQGLYPAAPNQQTSYEYGSYYAQDAAASPSDDVAPSLSDSYAATGDCCNSCGGSGCCELNCPEEEPCRLFESCRLSCLGIEVGGWVNAGFTWNPDDPANGYNTPVTFNDRANELQMNQLYTYIERATDTGGCGVDLGGRIDFLYGTDYYYTTALGLETEGIDGSQRWNRDKPSDPVRGAHQYGLAMPQAYLEAAVNDWTFKLGHFYTIIGYEVVTAPDNFFYSHAYTMQYGEPFTHTGALATYAVNDRVSVSGGFDRGWDRWEDDNDDLSFLGGMSWTSCDGDTTLSLAFTTGDELGASHAAFAPINDNRSMYSAVLSHKLSNRLTYVLQHDYGWQDNAARERGTGAISDAEWYGVNQYLFYQLDCCWTVGGRFEWFRDDDGVRTGGLGDGASDNAGHYWEVTGGVNYKPNANLVVRSEVRWDWSNTNVFGSRPYDDNSDGHQFLWGSDVILLY